MDPQGLVLVDGATEVKPLGLNIGQMPNLDLMRSIAIILVVLDHTLLALGIHRVGPWYSEWIGLAGVYMFFVHTCLVLMWSLERKPHTLDFYIRRIFRIYPLAITAVVIACITRAPVAGDIVNGVPRLPWDLRNFIQNCLLMQNFHGGNILGVLWSLPLEVDMYVLLPALFFFVSRNFAQWPLLLIWGLATLFCRTSMDPNGNNLAMVIPNFLPGVMAYVAFAKRRPVLPSWLFPVFIGVLFSALMFAPRLKWSWFFCLALGLGIASFKQVKNRGVVWMSHTIAKYSYGIYLAHPFGIWAGFYPMPAAPGALKVSIEVATSVVLAILCYHLIERPLMKLGSRVAAYAESRYEQVERPVGLQA